MRTVLLSHSISKETPLYGGKKKTGLFREKDISRGDSSNVTRLAINTHTSTHVDVPSHFILKGKTLTDYDSGNWFFKNILVYSQRIEPGGRIDKVFFEGMREDRSVDFLILKTGFGQYRSNKDYIYRSPIVKVEVAVFLKKFFPNLRGVGVDFISVSSLLDRGEGRRTHRALLSKDILIVEDMDLSKLVATPDFMLVSPLLVQGADGSPVSAWAFYEKEDIFDYENFLFDFDGVIADSVEVKSEAFRSLYLPFGKPIADAVVKHHRANGGMTRFDKFRYYHKHFLKKTITEMEMKDFCRRYERFVIDRVIRAKYIPGVIPFLKKLKEKRKKLFVVSATPQEEMRYIIKRRGIQRYFIDVVGAPRSKKDNLILLLKKYGLPVRQTVFFGDSQQDRNAAFAARVMFVPMNYAGGSLGFKDFVSLMRERPSLKFFNDEPRSAMNCGGRKNDGSLS
jgi:HAD superfamily hydrolase (TIGR01549 family)